MQLLNDTKHKLISTHSRPIKRNTQNEVGSKQSIIAKYVQSIFVADKDQVKLCISNFLANAKPCELQKEAANKEQIKFSNYHPNYHAKEPRRDKFCTFCDLSTGYTSVLKKHIRRKHSAPTYMVHTSQQQQQLIWSKEINPRNIKGILRK